MGADKTKTKESTSQTVTATPEEQQLEKIQLGQAQAADPQQRQVQANSLNLINNLLTGQQLPGYLNSLPGGIDQNTVNDITQQSLHDIYPQFQASGVLDSGVAAQIASKTAAGVRNNAAQFNLQNLSQLLNLAVGGQAQVQQPLLANSGQLGSNLAGLRSVNQAGTTTSFAMNPFLKSFQTGLGKSFGEGLGTAASGGVSGGIGKFLK